MKSKISGYISSAMASALSFAVAQHASAEMKDYYEEKSNHCFGAALAGQNECPALNNAHTCSGTSTTDCSWDDWKITKSRKECEDLMHQNCPENWKKISK